MSCIRDGLSESERDALRALIKQRTIALVAHTIGVGCDTLARAVAGFDVHRATVVAVRVGLREMRAA